MELTEIYADLKSTINSAIKELSYDSYYEHLYEPLFYSLNLPSKRVRPTLCILASRIFSEKRKEAMNAALGIEFFHTFTLIHDDIMDDADLRRGKETVYKKNGLNTAVLSGDVLYTLSLQLFESYEPVVYKQIMKVFNKASQKVCEGQQKDIEFEDAQEVDIEEYLEMIQNKTAVLAAAALKIGAIIGGASETDQNLLYDYGINMGMSFQLMDDYLDTYGDQNTFGKKIGGDIIQRKKTYLLLKSLEVLDDEKAKKLKELVDNEGLEESDKISKVKSLFDEAQAKQALKQKSDLYHAESELLLDKISGNSEAKDELRDYVNTLLRRNF